MAHYIDADRLRAEIERRFWDYGTPLHDDEVTTKVNEVLSIIDSLQKEQPDFPTTDEEIERLLATNPKVEVPNKYKTPDWLWKKQEQPEVDLEKKINTFFEGWTDCPDYGQALNSEGECVSTQEIIDIARQFAKWQEEQDKETIELAEDHAYLAGAVNEREKMMQEAAKDILCAVLAGGIANGANGFDAQKEELVNVSIGVADELIAKLKEK